MRLPPTKNGRPIVGVFQHPPQLHSSFRSPAVVPEKSLEEVVHLTAVSFNPLGLPTSRLQRPCSPHCVASLQRKTHIMREPASNGGLRTAPALFIDTYGTVPPPANFPRPKAPNEAPLQAQSQNGSQTTGKE